MSLNIEQKKVLVAEVHEVARSAQSVVAAEYRGLTVTQLTVLRAKAREAGVYVRVVKNTLARKAVEGTSFEPIGSQLKGPLILVFSKNDPGAAARLVKDFAKTNDKLVIRAGAFAGKALDVNGVKQLANIPSKEVLLAQLCGLLMSPISRTAVVLGALAAKKGEGAAAPAEAPEAEAAAA